MDKLKVTIGIPAYNEEANIGFLLEDLLQQNSVNYDLEKIIVASDASTDKTDEIVNAYKDRNVILLTNGVREGQGAKQNLIIESCDSDVLVLLNADILIEGKDFMDALVKPTMEGADLVCGPLHEIKPIGFFENVLRFGSEYRRRVFEKDNAGKNLFTCHGSHRAFSKNLYKNFRFMGSIAEDAYSYLYCVKYNFKYAYAKDAIACIKLPTNLREHLSQSSRFFSSNNKLTNFFETDFIKANTNWPVVIFASEGIKMFFEYPVQAVSYFFVSVYIMLVDKLGISEKNDTWKIVTSSKVVRS